MKYTINYKEITWVMFDGAVIRSPETLCKEAHCLINDSKEYDTCQEQVWLFGLNNKNEIKLFHLIAKGSHNSCAISGADVFSHLLRLNLRNFIICHNHPSGDLVASDEDITFSKKLKKGADILGLNFIDNVIIANDNDGFFSFKNKNLL